MEKEYLTKEKFEELKAELENLTSVKRKEIAKELEQTGSMGDLRENAEYQQARESQAELEQRISKIETMLKSAVIVEAGRTDLVGIGNTVVVSKKGQKEEVAYKIVGDEESSMVEKKISTRSPLANAMLGKKKGDVFSFVAPNGSVMEYKVIDIK